MQNNPAWWSKQHDSAWDRIKAALRRDWEQTKSDFSRQTGHDLGQTAGDTVKQAVGKEPIPGWEHVEPAYRYAVGARTHYGPSWDEAVLQHEWTTLVDGRKWEDVKAHVRHAWDYKA